MRYCPCRHRRLRIGPHRRLVRYTVPIDDVLSVKRRLGVTLNDVCLAMSAGALRRLALARGESPRPLKAMVPVNVRDASDDGSIGNRISFAFIDLPLDVGSPQRRIARIRFRADVPGEFEVELEHSSVRIAELTVSP